MPSEIFLHAALVTFDDRAVLISGHSGAGKSTLCGALVDAGAEYLTDEVVGLDESGAVERWMPRPLALDGNSLDLLGAVSPGRVGWPPSPEEAADELLVPMPQPRPRQGPIRPAVVVVLDGREGSAEFAPCPRSTAVARLVGQSFLPGGRTQAVLDRVELLTRTAEVGILTGFGLADRRDRILRAVA